MKALNDIGEQHSPVHGFAYDGYPIFGPYQAANTLAVSCWQPRDYSAASPTGCSDGQRSCVLNDQYNISKGVSTASSAGPTFGATVMTQSGNSISAVSGVYYQDYFYNHACGQQGAQYLDENNGHDHDGIGYHYHMTMDGAGTPQFPYVLGPKFYGCLPNRECPSTFGAAGTASQGGGGGGNSVRMSQCGVSLAVESQQCLSYTFDSGYATTFTDDDASDDSSDSKKGLAIGAIVGIAVGGVVGIALIAALIYWFVFHKSAAVVKVASV
jgi:hypothetical protein